MRTSSLQSINRSTLLTHQAEYTERRRESEVGNEQLSLHNYLKNLQQLSKSREIEKKVFQSLIHAKHRHHHTISQSPKTFPSQPHIMSQNSLANNKKFRSQKSMLVQSKQYHQNQYNEINEPKLLKLNEALLELVHSLNQLKEKLNNDRKMYFVVKKAVGQKKILCKMLLNPEQEILIEPFTTYILRQGIVIKEHITEGPMTFEIDTFNFSIIKEIYFLNEKIQELIIQAEINELGQVQSNIITEMDKFELIEKQVIKRGSQPIKNLRFQNRYMRRLPLNDELQSMERRLGVFPLITNRNKELDNSLSQVVQQLNTKFKQQK